MLTIIAAAALAAAQAPAAPAAPAHAQHTQMGAMPGMDHSMMDHSKMDHSKMDHSATAQKGECCCKHGADGKMECDMSGKDGSASEHQGHSH